MDGTELNRQNMWVFQYLYHVLRPRPGMRLEVVKLPTAKRGFVLLPRRWVVERSFAWMARFRRLARDYERLPETLAGLHFLAFAMVLLKRFKMVPSGCTIRREEATWSTDAQLVPTWVRLLH